MRISDWSSDVCSSDLQHRIERGRDAGRRGRALCLWIGRGAQLRRASRAPPAERTAGARNAAGVPANAAEIGRASCRERVCQYGVGVGGCRNVKKKKNVSLIGVKNSDKNNKH